MLLLHIWCRGTGRTATFSVQKNNFATEKMTAGKNGSRAVFAYRAGAAVFSVCRKSLAEFAPAGAKKTGSFFPGTCASGKTPLAERTVRAKRVRGAERFPLKA